MANQIYDALLKIREGLDLLIDAHGEKILSADKKKEDVSPQDMSFAQLKKHAKSLGIDASGTQKELLARVMGEDDEEDEKPSNVRKFPEKEESTKKGRAKKPEPEQEPEEDEEEDEEEMDIDALIEELSDEELAEVLESAGLSAKGKRPTLEKRVKKAIEDGTISLDEEDDEDEEESEDDEDEEVSERDEAIETFRESTQESIDAGDISDKDLKDWIADYEGIAAKEVKEKGAKLFDRYIELAANFIDDGGEYKEEPGQYTIDDEPYCCGYPLKKKGKMLVCESCGEKYKA